MPHTYYIIDEDTEVTKTDDRSVAIQAALDNDMVTVISPHENEWWVGAERQKIPTYKPPVSDDDEDINPDDPDGEGADE